MKNFLLATSLLLLMTACSNQVDLAIDNPSEFSVELMVDSLEVIVPPKQIIWVEMGKGKHTITFRNDSVVEFDFQQEVYFVNPTLAEYLVMEEFYSANEMFTGPGSLPNKTITYMGMEFTGNYDVVKDLISPVTWDYGARENLPEMVQIDADENYTTLVKLYDPYEFIELMTAEMEDEDYGEYGELESEDGIENSEMPAEIEMELSEEPSAGS